MKKGIIISLIIVIIIFVGLFWKQRTDNSKLTQEIIWLKQTISWLQQQISWTTIVSTTTEVQSGSRYWKLYSNNYSLYTKSPMEYEICLAWNRNICIYILQYDWAFKEYYKTIMPKEDRDNLSPSWQPMITETIKGKLSRKCTLFIESWICFNENASGSLIMTINDQAWTWFHGWVYDFREILKVIGF